jgi:hypothetical protein
MKGLVLLLLVAGLFILGPVLAIWSVNTLFHTDIPFTLRTFIAAIILMGLFKSEVSYKKS